MDQGSVFSTTSFSPSSVAAGVFMGLLYEPLEETARLHTLALRRPRTTERRAKWRAHTRAQGLENIPPRGEAVSPLARAIKKYQSSENKSNLGSTDRCVGPPLTRGNRNEWPGGRKGPKMDATQGSYVTLDRVILVPWGGSFLREKGFETWPRHHG